jgi:hypothetical protein
MQKNDPMNKAAPEGVACRMSQSIATPIATLCDAQAELRETRALMKRLDDLTAAPTVAKPDQSSHEETG